MTYSIFIFTFSPIQSFIVEARRAADLYTGSQILVELAKSVAESIGKDRLIYPALDEKGNLPQDIPNKLVAQVPFEECEKIAENARQALLNCWNGEKGIAPKAREIFDREAKIPFDRTIWKSQTGNDYLWETYWSASELDERSYEKVYAEAEAGLSAAKFSRPFFQYHEEGFKDTLSGKREALHGVGQDGREYWYQVGQVDSITPIKIRPSVENKENPKKSRPRERLDAIGVIKRFSPISEKSVKPFHGFPSTSSIAAWSFLASAQKFTPEFLKKHHEKIQNLLPEKKYKIRDDEFWMYDGDLLYPETLRKKRMESDYGKNLEDEDLKPAIENLSALYKALRNQREELRNANDPRYTEIITRPSPYYAVIVLDGDNMGKHLNTLNEAGHRSFSASLQAFSNEVLKIAEKHLARVIYNGGDDVLALAPLATAFACAQELAQKFKTATTRTASAGISLAHHLSPLGTALRAARRAEHKAKELSQDKDALCILALKRSGEPIEVSSRWDNLPPFEHVVAHFTKDEISSRLPYDVARAAYSLPNADDKFEAELRRLLKRHWEKGKDEEKDTAVKGLSASLRKWAESFPQTETPSQSEELAGWLALARFIAKGGSE